MNKIKRAMERDLVKRERGTKTKKRKARKGKEHKTRR